MMQGKIDQGTIIYGIRSEKYPNIPCYGVIITARCDIAQGKVPKYYYLVAVDASEWFCTEHGYIQTYSAMMKQKKDEVCKIANELELDGETLLSVPEELREEILADKMKSVKGKSLEKKFDSLMKTIGKYYEIAQEKTDSSSKRVAIQNNSKIAIQHLKDIDAGKMHHYYFLPQVAYLKDGEKNKGLIVDMLEIGVISTLDAEKITSPFMSGIYFDGLPQVPKVEELGEEGITECQLAQIVEYIRLKTSFWLEDKSDFVAIEGAIQSPWREHLMQRFSNAFIRIGLENPSEHDFENVVARCFEEEHK